MTMVLITNSNDVLKDYNQVAEVGSQVDNLTKIADVKEK
jgi:hypothetical protein